MALFKSHQLPGNRGQTVREWNDEQRRDEFVIRWRHVLLAFGLGFMCAVFWIG